MVHEEDEYRLDSTALESYLIPKSRKAADPDRIRSTGRGVAYTRTAFAYVFRVS